MDVMSKELGLIKLTATFLAGLAFLALPARFLALKSVETELVKK